ncbi:Nif3-like dinuclear metal center hexameric protein [Methylococcus mesophilus]|uniref:Nif3-like dinuclear metal center hexameric protein n=1 Tax=Methylococcus mesophilus TaxID=2993564 RepID=UPI00224B9118|nr:Nif3-like dinuclear metal center hexameric protein [Methylococcus mesophilus]UZR28691.1 Nif3-like dinuclear metal center hexameric protein [Methylococcus mesophilus]
MATTRSALEQFLAVLLNPGAFADYGPNGLQIEGREEIRRIAFAVSATAHSVAAAAEWQADALIVHHGLFWTFHGARPLVGPFAGRVFPLVRNAINLFAYHLPLDAHPEIGNAAVLGHRIGLGEQAPFGDHQGCPTGVRGKLQVTLPASALRERLAEILEHPVLLATPDATAPVRTVGIITGGANGGWAEAAKAGLDAYISGEMSEHDWHEAQEAGIHMYAGGHNATERFGIQALMERIRRDLDVACRFIPSVNPA